MTPRMPRRELPDPYKVEIVLDSKNPSGCRLTTFALTYPRFVHSELLTHRIFSRNSASSRAIPSEKMRSLVKEHPALPIFWGKNQSGMQSREELDNRTKCGTCYGTGTEQLSYDGGGGEKCTCRSCRGIGYGYGIPSPRAEAKKLWLEARDLMIEYSDRLAKLGLHKQLCNRLTEPWMPITVLVSATSFANWFHLRDHKDAQPELQVIATEMHYQYLESESRRLAIGEWHMPYIRLADLEEIDLRLSMDPKLAYSTIHLAQKVSVGRCARVSYLSHEGTRDLAKDVELHDKLAATANSDDPGHFSPFEHVAEALESATQYGNFYGWKQYRKQFVNEAGPQKYES